MVQTSQVGVIVATTVLICGAVLVGCVVLTVVLARRRKRLKSKKTGPAATPKPAKRPLNPTTLASAEAVKPLPESRAGSRPVVATQQEILRLRVSANKQAYSQQAAVDTQILQEERRKRQMEALPKLESSHDSSNWLTVIPVGWRGEEEEEEEEEEEVMGEVEVVEVMEEEEEEEVEEVEEEEYLNSRGEGQREMDIGPIEAQVLPEEMHWTPPLKQQPPPTIVPEALVQILSQEASQYSSTQPTLTVLSYNVRCDKDKKPHRWIDRAPLVAETIHESGADVVCLQEAKQAYARDLARSLGNNWSCSGCPRRKNDEGTQILFAKDRLLFLGSSTFVFTDGGCVQCPPSSSCSVRSVFQGNKCAHVRIFTHTRFADATLQTRLHVLNTHYPLETHEQQLCSEQLVKYVERHIPENEAVLLCGDLNSHYSPKKTGTPLRTLLQSCHGFEDCHGEQDFPSYTDGFRVDTFNQATTHRLDYMLLRPSNYVELIDADMMNPRYELDGEQYRVSDHEPLRVSISF